MKQLACSQIGGPADCTTMIPGNDAAEIGQNGMKHLEEKHPELAAQVKAMTKEQTDTWMADTQAKLDAQPEMAA